MLEIRDLHVHYGGIAALKGLTLNVAQGELVAVIGSNGAGKTTMLKTISSLVRPKSGEIIFDGKSLTKLKAHQVVSLRIAHCPEGRRVFSQQSVRDNLLLGAYRRFGAEGRKAIESEINKIYEIFPRLRERHQQLAGTLSGGEQQMLAIGRALMLKPRLLLLDEPSMGLAPIIIDEMFAVIRTLRQTGVTILLVEQLAFKALQVADRAYVLEQGQVRLSGESQNLLRDPEVQKAYLGTR